MPDEFRFLIDETALAHAAQGGPAAINEAFDALATLIQDARSHTIGKFSLIWEEQLGAHPLYDWLFDPAHGIDRVVADALRVALARTPDWDDVLDTTGLSPNVSIAGVNHSAPSVAAAEQATAAGRATGCLSTVEPHRGRVPVTAGARTTEIHFVGDSAALLAFFRDLPEVENLDEANYFRNAAFAFPNLHFVRDKTQFGHFVADGPRPRGSDELTAR
jgi:hypothetical protein